MKLLSHYAWIAIAMLTGVVLAGCTGCATGVPKIELPDISASSLTYKRTDPAGGTVIEAVNLVDHGTHVTAEKLKVTTIYPSISFTVDVLDYKRIKPAPAAPTAEAR